MSETPSFPPSLHRSLQVNWACCPPGSKHTFSIKPIRDLLYKYITPSSISIDPFCGESLLATYRNDLAKSGKRANEWLDELIGHGVIADVVLLDPPYSPRQIKEAYNGVGIQCSMTDTQNAKLYADARERLDKLLKRSGIAISFGWNTTGFGKKYGYEALEILVVNHGAAHNDTLVKVEYKP